MKRTVKYCEVNVRIEDIQLRGQPLKHLEEFKYLGSMTSSDKKLTKDID